MPPKHSIPLLRPSRVIFVVAMTILAALVFWVAVRAVGPSTGGVGQPTVVLPSIAKVPVGVVVLPSPSGFTPGVPVSVAPTPSPSRTSRRPSSPTPSRTTPSTHTPSKSAKPTTAPPVTLAATVSLSASWDGGYVANVRLTNSGAKSVNWTVTVTHSGQTRLRLTETWNATGSQRGSSFVFTGGPLAPGATATFGFQSAGQSQGAARPAGCSVVGGTCTVR